MTEKTDCDVHSPIICAAMFVMWAAALAFVIWLQAPDGAGAAFHAHHAPLPALSAPRYSYECPYGEMDADELHDANTVRAASRCWEDV